MPILIIRVSKMLGMGGADNRNKELIAETLLICVKLPLISSSFRNKA